MTDLQSEKACLRAEHLALRRALPPDRKQALDCAVAERVLTLPQYAEAKTLLCYVSTDIEVDTRALITAALQSGKTVAVPRCLPGRPELSFHVIESLSALQPGAYGILEPPKAAPSPAFSDALCVVPGLCWDTAGFRVGYGKGYYDRFLAQFPGETVGLAYAFDLTRHVPHDGFDRRVACLVTPQRTLQTEPSP